MEEVSLIECKKQILGILINIASFCEKNDIKYSLAYGTLIGAIRHKGFIPWDDDIDIIMRRDEYDRFISLYHDDYYNLIKEDNVPNHLHARVSDPSLRLEFTNSLRANKIYKGGVWVDVFPIDKVPEDDNRYWKIKKKVKKQFEMICVAEVKGYNMIQNIAHLFLSPFKRFLINRSQKEIKKYNNTNSTKAAALCVWHKNFPPFLWSYLDEYVDVEFEGHSFKSIKEYDAFLRSVYGNYMQFPPENQRVAHHFYKAFWRNENNKK